MRDLGGIEVVSGEKRTERWADRWLLLVMVFGALSACGRRETGGQVGVPGDAGTTNDAGPTEVQIIRTPGKLQGSPASAVYVPALDSGVRITGFLDAGPGRPPE